MSTDLNLKLFVIVFMYNIHVFVLFLCLYCKWIVKPGGASWWYSWPSVAHLAQPATLPSTDRWESRSVKTGERETQAGNSRAWFWGWEGRLQVYRESCGRLKGGVGGREGVHCCLAACLARLQSQFQLQSVRASEPGHNARPSPGGGWGGEKEMTWCQWPGQGWCRDLGLPCFSGVGLPS